VWIYSSPYILNGEIMDVLKWKCPKCGKVIESLYPNQFEYNKKQHIASHKRRER